MKVWITKYLGTMGLIEREATIAKWDTRYVEVKLYENSATTCSFRLDGHAFTDRKKALVKAQSELAKKRASLKKQMAKLDRVAAALERESAKEST